MQDVTRRAALRGALGTGVAGALTVGSASPALAAPTVVNRWVGAVHQSGATVAVKAAGASTVRLVVSPDADLATALLRTAAASCDGNGRAKLAVGGLQAGTRYHYAVEAGGVLDRSSSGSFRTAPAAGSDFTFAFASCCNNPGASTFAEIRSHDPDLFVHLGDLHYGDIGVDSASAFRARYDKALGSGYQAPLYAGVPTVYTWSDHDYGPNGADRTSPSREAAQAAYRDCVPSYALPSGSGGIYQTFRYGRVRFVVTDNRSFKSPRSAVDDGRKTMLGAEQKEWFKRTVAGSPEPVVVWVNENPWISRPGRTLDWWGGYTTERAELARSIAASGKGVAIVSGDMHALAADDGRNSPGGIPVFQAAALHGNSSHKGGPYTHGPFPAREGVKVQQYGVVRVEDSGSRIALRFTGYRLGRVAALTYTHTFTV